MNGKKLLPFDLETAKAHPEWLYTRNGCKARILCEDLKDSNRPIVAAYELDPYDKEEFCPYTMEGRYNLCDTRPNDLVLRVPKKRKVVKYANYYSDNGRVGGLYDTPEEAAGATIYKEHSVVAKSRMGGRSMWDIIKQVAILALVLIVGIPIALSAIAMVVQLGRIFWWLITGKGYDD